MIQQLWLKKLKKSLSKKLKKILVSCFEYYMHIIFKMSTIQTLFKNIKSIADLSNSNTETTVSGWVKTCRDQKCMIFIHLSDGTCQNTLQIILDPTKILNYNECTAITTGTSLTVSGKLVPSPAKGQLFELEASSVTLHQLCPTNYPFQKVGLPLDHMRKYPHLRHRTNLMRAIFKCKSQIFLQIHNYFTKNDYCHVDLPIITTNACEGGCQPLQVTSLLTTNGCKIPTISKTSDIDYSQDFFNNPVYLTVSNQLHLECFAHGLGYVYTITPATRGEPSVSPKHLAYFNMLEWEFSFNDLDYNISIAEKLIKSCALDLLKNCAPEMEMLNKAAGGKLIQKLDKLINSEFIKISHYDAITLLNQYHIETPFENPPKYTDDLSGEHERFLVKHFDQPVVIMRYPKNVKAFYMPVHHSLEVEGETIHYVDCFDLLMDVGEVVGGSQRIWHENELLERMAELSIDAKHLDWYVDLRRFGSVPHGGAGLGIERLVASLTGMSNVKDCITFPITVGHCTY